MLQELPKPVVLVGGGGHALSILDVAEEATSVHTVAGFLALSGEQSLLASYAKFIGGDEFLDSPEAHNYRYIIAFGGINRLEARSVLSAKLRQRRLLAPPVVSRLATVAKSVLVDDGAVVFKNATLNTGVRVGKNTHVNTGAIVEHGSVVGQDVMISPGVIVLGNCSIGDNVFVGAGAVFFNNIVVGSHAVIAAGSIVRHDVPAGVVHR